MASKSVLVVGEVEGSRERRENQSLQNFYRRRKERDWAVGQTLLRRLPRLQNRDDSRGLPDRRDLRIGDRQIEGVCEILDRAGANVFKVPGREAVGPTSRGVFGGTDGGGDFLGRERTEGSINGMFLIQVTDDFPRISPGVGERAVLSDEPIGDGFRFG